MMHDSLLNFHGIALFWTPCTGCPKKTKTIEITIVKIWMPFQTAERNDA
jgi:hypothetical protein